MFQLPQEDAAAAPVGNQPVPGLGGPGQGSQGWSLQQLRSLQQQQQQLGLQQELAQGQQQALMLGQDQGAMLGQQQDVMLGQQRGLQQQDLILGQQLVAEGLHRSLSQEVYQQQSEAQGSLDLQVRLSHVLSQMQGLGGCRGWGVPGRCPRPLRPRQSWPPPWRRQTCGPAEVQPADAYHHPPQEGSARAAQHPQGQGHGQGEGQGQGQGMYAPGVHPPGSSQGYATVPDLARGEGLGSLFGEDAASTSGRGAGRGRGRAGGRDGADGAEPLLCVQALGRVRRGSSAHFNAMAAVAEAAVLAVDGEGVWRGRVREGI